MTPAEYRALAARVETEEPSAPLNSDVGEAFGWEPGEHGIWWKSPDGVWRMGLPDFLTDLTAAAGLMPEGWKVRELRQSGDVWIFLARNLDIICFADSVAPTEPRARVAAALRAKAAGMEAGE